MKSFHIMLRIPALFYSSVKCTGAPINKDILVHRCTSQMNKTMHPMRRWQRIQNDSSFLKSDCEKVRVSEPYRSTGTDEYGILWQYLIDRCWFQIPSRLVFIYSVWSPANSVRARMTSTSRPIGFSVVIKSTSCYPDCCRLKQRVEPREHNYITQ